MTKSTLDNVSEPTGISRLLSNVIADRQWRSKLELHKIFELWYSIVGPEIATVAQPSLIRSQVLWVKVTESIWMQQLHLQKILLLEKINKQLHAEKITDIRFQLNSSLSPPPPEPLSEKSKPVLLDKKEEQAFDKLISTLENEALRASLKSLWVMVKTKGNRKD